MYKFFISVKKIIPVAALAVLLLPTMADAKTVRLGHAMPVDHPQSKAMTKFAEEVKKNTDGNIDIQLFPGAVLGGDDKMLQALQSGNLEFYIGGVAPLSGKVKQVQVIDFPFLFDNRAHAINFYSNSKVANEILNNMSEVGIIGLSWADFGFRQLTNSKKQINAADDISGLKIRVMQNPVAIDTWKSLGANAIAMSFSEVFTALEQKAIDGQENPLPHIYNSRIHEVQKYISLTNHSYVPVALVSSKKWFDTLDTKEQQAIREAAKVAAKYQAEYIGEAEKSVADKITATGVKIDEISPDEMNKIRAKTAPVIEKYTDQIGSDFVKKFLGEVDSYR